MKKTILKITAISALSLTIACSNQAKESHDHEQTESVEKTEEVHEEESHDLVLDDGKRWIANPETTTGVENMMAIMDSFTAKDSVEAYKELTTSLKAEFTMIFQKCTMTGEAHNQLHNFLIPIKETFEKLSSNDLSECQEGYDFLNEHLKSYKKYFN